MTPSMHTEPNKYHPKLIRAVKAYNLRSMGLSYRKIGHKMGVHEITALRDVRWCHDWIANNLDRESVQHHFCRIFGMSIDDIRTLFTYMDSKVRSKRRRDAF